MFPAWVASASNPTACIYGYSMYFEYSGLPEFRVFYMITLILKSISYLTRSKCKDFIGPVTDEELEV